LISLKDGIGKGSGRSVADFNIYEGLKECDSLLLSYGGHRYAAGISIKEEDIKKFSGMLEEIISKELGVSHFVSQTNIDAICMWLLKNPFDYDVLVAPNLYGDIISDLCAQMVGGLGFGCSGNIGKELAVFEPTHGSAPKYAGMNKVNPIATILAAKMMLDWLGETERADRLEKAVAAVIAEGAVRTYDTGGANTTVQLAEAIAARL
jgi:isocitrate/isopropylmalate dehydrogenase